MIPPWLDVSVFGPYTYLVTEVLFGSVALALLVRAGALRRAARTIGVLYPVAYVWDWYTLTVGVFAVELRTGVDLLGIPVEEHLFILVVPGFVLGIHETLHPSGAATTDDATSGDATSRENETARGPPPTSRDEADRTGPVRTESDADRG